MRAFLLISLKVFLMSEFNITTDKTKEHLRVLHNRDDAQINLFIKTALVDIANFIDRELLSVTDPTGDLPAPLEAAVYMIVGDLYHNRSTQSDKSYFSNPTFERLVFPYRKMGV